MTDLIQRQLLVIGIMLYCGLAAGLVRTLFTRFGRRFSHHRILCGIALLVSYLLIAWLFGVFAYQACFGKITFTACVSFLLGLWLWKKLFCDTI